MDKGEEMISFKNTDTYRRISINASWNNAHLDSRVPPESCAIEDAIKHLEDCKNYPTVALLARKKFRTAYYPGLYYEHLDRIYQSSNAVRIADRAYRERFNKLYPKTGYARKLLIFKESIVLDRVKPIQNNLKRLLIKFLARK